MLDKSPVVIDELAALLAARSPLLPAHPLALQVRLQRRHLSTDDPVTSESKVILGSCPQQESWSRISSLRLRMGAVNVRRQ